MESFLATLFTPLDAPPSVSDLVLRLLFAWLAGQLTGWLYVQSHESLSYSESYVKALVLMTMVVCLIVVAVGGSFARFFILGTSLSIVRFRTPLKEPRDTAFLFLAAGLGLVTGLGLYVLAIPAAALVGATAIYLRWSSFGARSSTDGVLRVKFQREASAGQAIEEVLPRYCARWALALSKSAEGAEDRIYDVSLRDPNRGDAMLRELMGLAGVNEVSLLNQARAGEA